MRKVFKYLGIYLVLSAILMLVFSILMLSTTNTYNEGITLLMLFGITSIISFFILDILT